jgi:hypothetical protein
MSIIEDSGNLSKQGKWICGILLALGCIVVISIWVKATQIPELYRQAKKTGEVHEALPSRPEEIVIPYGGLPPTDPQGKRSRVNDMNTTLQGIQAEVDPEMRMPPRELLMAATARGAIHPWEAQTLAEEMLILSATEE